MTTVLTPDLIEYFSNNGYRYCLSKTNSIDKGGADVAILLKPVKSRPALKRLPAGYDTYFPLNREPVHMAEGIDRTLIMVEITHTHLLNYIGFYINKFKKGMVA